MQDNNIQLETEARQKISIRQRLNYHSWRRGMKEMDIILGQYADINLATMDEATLMRYESLLKRHDQDLLPLFTEFKKPAQDDPDLAMIECLIAFVKSGGAVLRQGIEPS